MGIFQICENQISVLNFWIKNEENETEQAEGLKQYGVSKEHRPPPIVQMGLFMDDFSLAFCINPSNTNE